MSKYVFYSSRLPWMVTWLLVVLASSVRGQADGAPQAARQELPSSAASSSVTGDWPQWGGSPSRNNAPNTGRMPTRWEVGSFDFQTGKWNKDGSSNVAWVAQLGSISYGNPVVAHGKVYVGTNNGAGYLPRYPAQVDLGVLLCFREADGQLLWQHSSEKLPTGRAHDWPMQGICSTPMVEGDRLWFVTSRGEVVCLDTEGFHDGENDGPVTDEPSSDEHEADVVWKFDMMGELGTSQLHMCSSSVTSWGDLLLVHTSNGVDETHERIPAPTAPSFLCMDKHTGRVLWTDNSPGENILHGQWSSPAAALLADVPQAIFPGGDGWLYSFRADQGEQGHPTLLWKFDCNPKESFWMGGSRGTRNNLLATPVIHDGLVYLAVGHDPDQGEGEGRLWCIDPTRRGDVSLELAVKADDSRQILAPRRRQAIDPQQGEMAIANPHSAAVWQYEKFDVNGDGKIEFDETMHRTCGTVAIRDNLLVVADLSGIVHCLDAKTGQPFWTYDLLAQVWGSPLIADQKIYIGDEQGDVTILHLDRERHEPIAEINMANSVFSTPVAANGRLYIATKTQLFAIEPESAESDGARPETTDPAR